MYLSSMTPMCTGDM